MRRLALSVSLALALGQSSACSKGSCEELESQLRACPRYQDDTDPIDCDGDEVNAQAECILQSGEDVCSVDGLAVANAACEK